ncbi:TVP38/TMEM64 family protein [Endothiovibrio diazotrophicus]
MLRNDFPAEIPQGQPTTGSATADRRRVIFAALALALLCALILAGRALLPDGALDVDRLTGYATALVNHPAAPLLAVGGIAVATTLAVPVTLLCIAAVLAFGPIHGLLYTLVGAELCSLLTYGAGRWAGREWVWRHAGGRLGRVHRLLERRGLLAVIALRMVPVAPFPLLGLAIGASPIRLYQVALGTVIGLLPVTTAIALFAEALAQALSAPVPLGSLRWLAAGVVVAAAAVALWLIGRRRPARAAAADLRR